MEAVLALPAPPFQLASAEGGNRTHTGLSAHWILSPARLPVPPLRLETRVALPPHRHDLAGSARPRSCRASGRLMGAEGGGSRGNHGFTRVLQRVCQFRHFGAEEEVAPSSCRHDSPARQDRALAGLRRACWSRRRGLTGEPWVPPCSSPDKDMPSELRRPSGYADTLRLM